GFRTSGDVANQSRSPSPAVKQRGRFSDTDSQPRAAVGSRQAFPGEPRVQQHRRHRRMSDMLPSETAWNIEPSDIPTAGSARDVLAFLVRYAILAPSGHNTQPWQFVVGQSHVDIVADRSRALHMVDPLDREMTMSCAAAAETMFTALRAFGLQGEL